MQYGKRWIVPVVIVIVGLAFVAWTQASPSVEPAPGVAAPLGLIEPAKIEPIEGSEFKRVILSQKAAERLDVQTTAVRDEQVGGTPRTVVPYAAILYGASGETWLYTNPDPLVFVRQSVTVERIEGDLAVLSDGPPADTVVAVVGVAELFGAETGWGGSGGH